MAAVVELDQVHSEAPNSIPVPIAIPTVTTYPSPDSKSTGYDIEARQMRQGGLKCCSLGNEARYAIICPDAFRSGVGHAVTNVNQMEGNWFRTANYYEPARHARAAASYVYRVVSTSVGLGTSRIGPLSYHFPVVGISISATAARGRFLHNH